MSAIWKALESRSCEPNAPDSYNWGQEPGMVFFRNQSSDPAMLMSVFINPQKQVANVPRFEDVALQIGTNETVQVTFSPGPPNVQAFYIIGKGC